MPTDVKLPQMGESIYEGTITKWLRQEGDFVKKDEPLYELSTDKVDSEIPSPVTGRILKIVVEAGKKVPIHTVIAQVEEQGAAAAPSSPSGAPAKSVPPPAPAPPKPAAAPATVATAGEPAPAGDGDRIFASPLVRKIARDENVELSQIKGTGIQGRITKEDLMSYLERRKGGTAVATPSFAVPSPTGAVGKAPEGKPAVSAPAPTPPPAPRFAAGARHHVEPMSPMRAKIADHMVMSRRTSAHVTTVFEVDLSKIVALRGREKDEYEKVYGTKLTFTPFFAMAAIQAVKDFPIVNASVEGANIVYKRDINLGIAVALPGGLIVPVVHNAEEKSFLGLCRAINDVAERSRTKKLAVHEVQGGTFTITNPGLYGGLFGTPIINQPQVAIMGVGGIEKRPVVIDDAIAVRSMCYLVLSFDHRVIDGAVADQFMAKVKQVLQGWNLPIK